MNNAVKSFDILATYSSNSSLRVLHNYFDSSTILFWSVSSWNFTSFSKTVYSMVL